MLELPDQETALQPLKNNRKPTLFPPRVVSGIQPAADLHLGHFFGAMAQHLHLQHEYPGESFFVIADCHALTRGYDRNLFREAVQILASAYLALGLDTNKAVLYRQSDVPQLMELFWILSCFSHDRDLRSIPSFKAAIHQGLAPTAALLTYPVLMAADILGLRATIVPVGHDQLPSLERVRAIARNFNNSHGCKLFPLPAERISGSPTVRGTDGRKMSKAYGNTIGLFDSYHELRSKIWSIRTDSRKRGEPREPDKCIVFHMYSLVSAPQDIAEMRSRYENGSIDYLDAKKQLLQAIQEYFDDARERFIDIRTRPAFVEDVLREGFRQAADQFALTTDSASQLMGLS